MSSELQFTPWRQWARDYKSKDLLSDLWAGLTSAIIVTPQAIAFSAIAGLPIELGLYTAIFAPLIAGLFGSSRQMISGPTTAISIMVYSALSTQFAAGSAEYITAAIVLTFMVGVIQLTLALFRLGSLSNFISDSVMVGFTSGAAVVILSTQIPTIFGVSISDSNLFVSKWTAITIPDSFWVVAAVTITALLSQKVVPKWPHHFIGLVVGVLTAYLADFDNLTHVEAVASIWPSIAVPDFSFELVSMLIQSAVAISLVGLLEATAIARSIALRSKHTINVNQEFFGQGLSNAIGSLFSCYASSGSFTRSGLNYDVGAKSPLSGFFASLLLLIFAPLVGPYFVWIPEAAIAGVIILVAVRLPDLEHIARVIRASKQASAVMIATFIATIFIGLEAGIFVGVVVSLGIFLQRSSNPYIAVMAPDPSDPLRRFKNASAYQLSECPQLTIVRIDGPLYFASLDIIRRRLLAIRKCFDKPRAQLMLLKGVSDIDLSGAQFLQLEASAMRHQDVDLFITARQHQISNTLTRTGVVSSLGNDHIFRGKTEALKQIIPSLDSNVCQACTVRIFKECPKKH